MVMVICQRTERNGSSRGSLWLLVHGAWYVGNASSVPPQLFLLTRGATEEQELMIGKGERRRGIQGCLVCLVANSQLLTIQCFSHSKTQLHAFSNSVCSFRKGKIKCAQAEVVSSHLATSNYKLKINSAQCHWIQVSKVIYTGGVGKVRVQL